MALSAKMPACQPTAETTVPPRRNQVSPLPAVVEHAALCIACMAREADPRNGGLCTVCAPPLRLGYRPRRSRLVLRCYHAAL